MKPQQIFALKHPCEQAMQCADQRYRKIYRKGPYMVSVVLTVNVGEE